MTKRITEFRRVSFDWMMPVEERQQVESLLKTLGYEVDGGGTNLEMKTSEICIRPKKRARRQAPRPAQPRTGDSTPPPAAAKREVTS